MCVRIIKNQEKTMNRRIIFSLTAITALGLAMMPTGAVSQQKSVKEQLVGAWAFVSSTAKLADGSPLWGTNPKGQLSRARTNAM